jgi:hypothetical protein
LFYSGELVGFFLSSLIGALVKVRLLMIGGLITSFLGILVVLFSDLFYLGAFGLFLIVVGTIISFNLTYIFVT